MNVKLKIKKGDAVVIIAGKDSGKKGTVLKVIPEKLRVIVSGVNIITKHMRPSMKHAGGIVKQEASVHVSNVAHSDPKTGLPTKIGYKLLEDGKKVRFAKKSGEVIDK